MATKSVKEIWKSKTFWIAIVQAVAGIAVAVFTELDLVGYVAVVKSIVDIIIRLITAEPVKLR